MPNTSNRSYPYPARSAAPGVGWRDIQQLAEAVDADVAAQVALSSSEAGVNNVGASDTTSSSSFDDLASSSFSWTKRNASTRIRVDMHFTCYATSALTSCEFGVRINGVDYQVGKLTFNNLSVHTQMGGVLYIAGGVAAGTYTVQGRWRRTGASGTLNTDSGDWLSIAVREVW